MKKLSYKQRSMIKIETVEDLELIKDAEKYNGFRFCILTPNEYEYMMTAFNGVINKDEQWNGKRIKGVDLFYEHKSFNVTAIQRVDKKFIFIVTFYVGERAEKIDKKFYKIFFKQFDIGGLAEFLDPNCAGAFDDAHKEVASMIIYG